MTVPCEYHHSYFSSLNRISVKTILSCRFPYKLDFKFFISFRIVLVKTSPMKYNGIPTKAFELISDSANYIDIFTRKSEKCIAASMIHKYALPHTLQFSGNASITLFSNVLSVCYCFLQQMRLVLLRLRLK